MIQTVEAYVSERRRVEEAWKGDCLSARGEAGHLNECMMAAGVSTDSEDR